MFFLVVNEIGVFFIWVKSKLLWIIFIYIFVCDFNNLLVIIIVYLKMFCNVRFCDC